MISLAVSVPVACWRKGAAREMWETELIPPPSTCYGMLLSLVGEIDRERHIGACVTSGVHELSRTSTVLRSLWRVKTRKNPPGNGNNASPDFQQLVTNAEVVIAVDSSQESDETTLEQRVLTALHDPAQITRFGGLSLGESTHLINDITLLPGEWGRSYHVFVAEDEGDVTLPVWVDHVGAVGSAYAVGTLCVMNKAPGPGSVPAIRPHK